MQLFEAFYFVADRFEIAGVAVHDYIFKDVVDGSSDSFEHGGVCT
jgi:hypothetical protein